MGPGSSPAVDRLDLAPCTVWAAVWFAIPLSIASSPAAGVTLMAWPQKQVRAATPLSLRTNFLLQ